MTVPERNRISQFAPESWGLDPTPESPPCVPYEETSGLIIKVAGFDVSPSDPALTQRVERLEQSVFGAASPPSFFEVRDAIEHIKKMTSEVFSDHFTIVEREDHEAENDRHFTFRVTDRADVDEVLQRYHTWHARLSEVPGSVRGMFRLSVDLSQ